MHMKVVALGAFLALLSDTYFSETAAYMQASDECAGADAYVATMHCLSDELEQELEAQNLSQDEIDSWTASDFANAARIMEETTFQLEEMTPPPAAAQVHDDDILLFGMLSQMFTSMQNEGLLGAIPYIDSIEQTTKDVEESAVEFELNCNVALFDDDGDGTPEIGRGALATPIAGSTPESRQSPVPIGTPVDVGH